jgi:hypothetical protein
MKKAIFEMAKELIKDSFDLYPQPEADGCASMTCAANLAELSKDYTETEGGDLEENLQIVHAAYRAVYGL